MPERKYRSFIIEVRTVPKTVIEEGKTYYFDPDYVERYHNQISDLIEAWEKYNPITQVVVALSTHAKRSSRRRFQSHVVGRFDQGGFISDPIIHFYNYAWWIRKLVELIAVNESIMKAVNPRLREGDSIYTQYYTLPKITLDHHAKITPVLRHSFSYC